MGTCLQLCCRHLTRGLLVILAILFHYSQCTDDLYAGLPFLAILIHVSDLLCVWVWYSVIRQTSVSYSRQRIACVAATCSPAQSPEVWAAELRSTAVKEPNSTQLTPHILAPLHIMICPYVFRGGRYAEYGGIACYILSNWLKCWYLLTNCWTDIIRCF